MVVTTNKLEFSKFMVLAVCALTIIITNCSQKKAEDDFLLRCQGLTLTFSEFNQAVEAASDEAFPGEKDIDPNSLNDLRIRTLNQAIEEMMISAYAAENGIQITEQELENAIKGIKADYPDDTFEQTLLENAISYEFWKKKLASRLLVEKVIEKELINQVQISSEDIEAYYKANYSQGTPKDETPDEIDQRIVNHLRQQKAEKAYKDWLETLRQKYPVEVNQKVWEHLIANTE